MRPHFLKLVGAAVLAGCAALIIHPVGNQTEALSGRGDNHAGIGPRLRSRVARNAPSTPVLGHAAPPREPFGQSETGVEINGSPIRRQPGERSPIATDRPLPAVQVSNTARLPAVMLVQADGDSTGQSSNTLEMDASTAALTDSFYQDLAGRVAAGRPDGVASAEGVGPLPDGQATAVVEPGPELDAATATANEQFRALFGQNAYNRNSIISALEVSTQAQAGGGN